MTLGPVVALPYLGQMWKAEVLLAADEATGTIPTHLVGVGQDLLHRWQAISGA
jgi:hypothetical protein